MRLPRLWPRPGSPGSGWFFGFFDLGGAVLILAALGAYFTRTLELSAGAGPCDPCGGGLLPPPGQPPLVWTSSELTLLAAGVVLAAIGTLGLALTWAWRGKYSRARLNRAEGGAWAGASGWCLGSSLFFLVLVWGPTTALPNGSGFPLFVGSLALLAFTAAVWAHRLLGVSIARAPPASSAS